MWWNCKNGKYLAARALALTTVLLSVVTWGFSAQAAPTAAPIIGEIERITLNDNADVYSGGKIVVGDQKRDTTREPPA
jgi:hypothetical protein